MRGFPGTVCQRRLHAPLLCISWVTAKTLKSLIGEDKKMKNLLAALVLIPLVLALLVVLGFGIAMQQGIASKADIDFLTDLGKRDGRPRILEFAIAPGIWAAYDTQQLSLYQVWEGEVLFEGAAYDYKHGPQPVSQGAWYLRYPEAAQWFIEADGEELPASVRYLGHEYGAGRETAAMRFVVSTGPYRLELTEQPELVQHDGGRSLTRHFARTDQAPTLKSDRQTDPPDDGPEEYLPDAIKAADVKVGFRTGDGERYLAEGTLSFPLNATTPIPPHTEGSMLDVAAGANEHAQGESVIANSDCLGCHAREHKVTGPAWGQIAGKFRGKAQQDVVTALTNSVLNGSVGTWGSIPMPHHPQLSEAQATAAVAYILSVDGQQANLNVPQDLSGNPYAATLAYDVLPRLRSLHPSFQLENLAPPGFEPKVGGMDFRDDGKLVVASWDSDGAVFLLDLDAPPGQRVKRIAEGLHEPLGLSVVGNRIFVLQKQELTELIDTNGDEIIDRYRAVTYDWPSSNFHSFAFGLLPQGEDFYFLLSICILPGGASCPEQLPTQGKLLRADKDGKVEIYASGFRTPNGIASGPHGAIYVTDNQGDWLPASKLIRIEKDGFYGSRTVPDEGVMTRAEIPPTVWLPQDEVGNPPNWGEYGKPWYGLERMSWIGNKAFEMLAVKAQHDGFVVELTQPLAAGLELSPADVLAKQWFYHPNEQYGGPKYDEMILPVSAVELAPDRRSIHLRIAGLKAGYVVYLRLADRLRAESGDKLWTAEAWYTLNRIPGGSPATAPVQAAGDGWRDLFDGKTLSGWRNYGGDESVVHKWTVQNGTLSLVQDGVFPMWDMIKSAMFGGPGGDLVYYREKFRDFELSLQWKISPGGNSGIFYLVKDETENVSWRTGIEMQVLDNDGHDDGQIHTHRAGDLYDLIAAEPETVRPPGEWNDVLIRVKDNLIEHWLNGVKVVSIKRGSEQWNTLVAASKFAAMPGYGKSEEGYIALQDHGDPVWFRAIRVREL